MRFSVCLLGFAMVAAGSGLASARSLKGPTLREQAEQVCYNDVTTLCNDAVPDEDRIRACMAAKRAQLSPGCRKVFEQGLKAH